MTGRFSEGEGAGSFWSSFETENYEDSEIGGSLRLTTIVNYLFTVSIKSAGPKITNKLRDKWNPLDSNQTPAHKKIFHDEGLNMNILLLER